MILHSDPQALRTAAPFSAIFPIKPHTLEAVAASMRTIGFDDAEPIVTWHGLVIDGHTRLAAAIAAGLSAVATVEREFSDEDEALEYAIKRQRDRRNLTDADMLRCVKVLDERKSRVDVARENGTSAPHGAPVSEKNRSSSKTAELLGTSARKVERAREVLDHASEETKAEVLAGEKSINAAVNESKPKPEPKAKPETDPDELARLKEENEDLQDRLHEAYSLLKEKEDELDAARRALDAEDLLGQFNKEIKRAQELSRITQARNNGLMNEVADLKGRLKSALRKIERLEKASVEVTA